MVDYFSLHVATSYQHLVVRKQKVVDKEIINKTREMKSKEKNERKIMKGWRYIYPSSTSNSKENWEGK